MMFLIEVVRVFNRKTDKTSYWKVTKEGKVRISKKEYDDLERLSFEADSFRTTSDGAITRNFKTLRFMFEPSKWL